MEPPRSHRLSACGWGLVALAGAAVGAIDFHAVRHRDVYYAMTEDAYRLHRLVRAGLWGALSGMAFEHFVLADPKSRAVE